MKVLVCAWARGEAFEKKLQVFINCRVNKKREMPFKNVFLICIFIDTQQVFMTFSKVYYEREKKKQSLT